MQSSVACACRGAFSAVAPDDPNATTVANTTLSAITARTPRSVRSGEVSEPHPDRVSR